MSFWSWFRKICTPYAFTRGQAHQDEDIAAGAMIGGVVGGVSKGLAVGVAASVGEQDKTGLLSAGDQGRPAPQTDDAGSKQTLH